MAFSRSYSVTHTHADISVDVLQQTIAGYVDLHVESCGSVMRLNAVQLNIARVTVRPAAVDDDSGDGERPTSSSTPVATGEVDAQFVCRDQVANAATLVAPDVRDLETFATVHRGEYELSEQGELLVAVPEALQAATADDVRRLVVRVHYSVQRPNSGAYFHRPTHDNMAPTMLTSGNACSTRWWLPCDDRPSAVCTWRLDVHCANAGFMAVCSGELSEQLVHTDESRVYCYEVREPVAPQCVGVVVSVFAVVPDPTLSNVTHFCPPRKRADLLNTVCTASALPLFVEFGERYLLKSVPYNCQKFVFVDCVLPKSRHAPVCSSVALSVLAADVLHPAAVLEQVYESRYLLAYAYASQFFGMKLYHGEHEDEWVMRAAAHYLALLCYRRSLGNNESRYRLYTVREALNRIAHCAQLPLYRGFVCHPAEQADRDDWQLKCHLAFWVLDVAVGAKAMQGFMQHMISTEEDKIEERAERRREEKRREEKRRGGGQRDGDEEEEAGASRYFIDEHGFWLYARRGEESWDGAILQRRWSTRALIASVFERTGFDLRASSLTWIFGKGFRRLDVGYWYNQKRHIVEIGIRQHMGEAALQEFETARRVGARTGVAGLKVRVVELDITHDRLVPLLGLYTKAEMKNRSRARRLHPEEVEQVYGGAEKGSGASCDIVLMTREERDTEVRQHQKEEEQLLRFGPDWLGAVGAPSLAQPPQPRDARRHVREDGWGDESSSEEVSEQKVEKRGPGRPRGPVKQPRRMPEAPKDKGGGADNEPSRNRKAKQAGVEGMDWPYPLRWLRPDPDMVYMGPVAFKQPLRAWLQQLAYDVDVVGQLCAIQGLVALPGAAPETVALLCQTLNDYGVFHRVRARAALALSELATRCVLDQRMLFAPLPPRDTLPLWREDWPPPVSGGAKPKRLKSDVVVQLCASHLLQFVDEHLRHAASGRIAPNDFADLSTYMVAKGVCVALCRFAPHYRPDGEQYTPDYVAQVALSVVQENDNALNEYSDAHYLAAVLRELPRIRVTQERALQPCIEQLHRYIQRDLITPWYKNLVTQSCLAALAELKCAARIEVDVFTVLAKYLEDVHYTGVRCAALRGLLLTEPLKSVDAVLQELGRDDIDELWRLTVLDETVSWLVAQEFVASEQFQLLVDEWRDGDEDSMARGEYAWKQLLRGGHWQCPVYRHRAVQLYRALTSTTGTPVCFRAHFAANGYQRRLGSESKHLALRQGPEFAAHYARGSVSPDEVTEAFRKRSRLPIPTVLDEYTPAPHSEKALPPVTPVFGDARSHQQQTKRKKANRAASVAEKRKQTAELIRLEQPAPPQDEAAKRLETRFVIDECPNAVNPYHDCTQYCRDMYAGGGGGTKKEAAVAPPSSPPPAAAVVAEQPVKAEEEATAEVVVKQEQPSEAVEPVVKEEPGAEAPLPPLRFRIIDGQVVVMDDADAEAAREAKKRKKEKKKMEKKRRKREAKAAAAAAVTGAATAAPTVAAMPTDAAVAEAAAVTAAEAAGAESATATAAPAAATAAPAAEAAGSEAAAATAAPAAVAMPTDAAGAVSAAATAAPAAAAAGSEAAAATAAPVAVAMPTDKAVAEAAAATAAAEAMPAGPPADQ